MWVLDRAQNKGNAVETPIGFEPTADDINIEGLDISKETLKGLLEVDPALWKEDIVSIKEFYAKVGAKLPAELEAQLEALEKRLG